MGKGGDKGHTPVEQPDNLKSRQQLAVIDLVAEGEVEGPINGLQAVFLNDTPVENPDGSYNFSGITAQWTRGTQGQAPLAGFAYLENEQPVSAEVTAATPLVRGVTDPNIDRLRLTFGVQSLFQQEDNGDLNGSSVQFAIQLSDVHGWRGEQYHTIEGKTRSEYLISVELDDLPPVPFNIRLKRLTPDSDNSKLNNRTVWSSYTEIIDTKLRYPNTALVGLTLDAEQFSGVPRRNYLIRGRRVKVPSNYDPASRAYTGLWDGTFKIAWTNNPAWIYYDLGTCERAGIGRLLGAQGVDKWVMYQLAQYCDHLVPDGHGGHEPRFTCNVAITEPQQAHEVFSQLSSVFRGMPIWDGMQLSVSPDIPSDPVHRYTNANVIEGKFSYQSSPLKSRHTAAHVRWQDPENGWEESTEYVSDDESIIRYGLNVARIDAFGCKSRGQAARAGQWLLVTEHHERNTVSFSVGREGLRHQAGDIIEIADNQFAGASIGGRVKSIEDKRVTLDRAVEISAGDSGWLGYITGEGKEKLIGIFSHPEPDVVVLDELPEGLDNFGVWTLATTSLEPTLWRCITISEEADGTFGVTALQHVPEKHQIIENGIKFDPPESTLYSGKIPPIERLQAEVMPEDSQFQVRLTWDTPRTIEGLKFRVKLSRNDAVRARETVDDTEYLAGTLDIGSYTAYVRGVNGQGQLGPETMVAFDIAAPAVPVDIDIEADNLSLTARPVIDGPTALGTQYEWYFGQTQDAVINRLTPLGRAFILNKQALKPDTQYWLGVEAVNSVGRSGLLTKAAKTLLKPDDILQIIGPEIPKLDWAKELNQMVEDNSAAVILLGNRAALVVNQDGRVSGMTVSASSEASAIDFMADYVSFTDPDTRQRNLYWDNALKTLVMKGQIKLLDGHTVSGLDDIRAQDGDDGDTIYTEFQFSADGSSWHFPDQPGDIYLRSRVVTNGSAGAWGAATNLKGDKGDSATERYTWIRYADSASGEGLSNDPAGKAYIGVAYNRTSAAESNNAAEYSWSLIRGADGDTVYTEFQFSADGSSWHFPEQAGDIYLRTRVVTNGNAGAWGAATNLKGDKGDDATERYTWIRYADSANGAGLSNNPAGKAYIGVAYNRTSAAESSNPAEYSWSLIRGADGDTVYTEFQFSANGSSWHFPEQSGDIYLRTRVVTNGNAGAWGAATNLKGDKGDDATERYTWIRYADSANGAGLSNNPAGKAYIGVAYNRTSAAESSNPAEYSWSLIRGADGDTVYTEFQFSANGSSWHFPEQSGDIYLRTRVVTNGNAGAWGAETNLKGDKGDDATERYTWIRYADSASGAGLSNNPAGKAYIGVAYNRTSATESSNAADYSWSLIRGADGDTVYTEFQFSANGSSWHFPEQSGDIYLRTRVVTNGNAGAWGAATNLKGDKGDDATERYTWFKYADGPDGAGLSDDGTGKAYIGIAYNRTSPVESTNPADYAWTKIQGKDGADGRPGAGVFRLQTTTGVFPTSDEVANSLFASHTGRAPVLDDVLSVYSVDGNGYVSQADSKMFDGSSWVKPKMFIDGDLIALGTIRGEHIVAGIELRAPRIRGGDIGIGEGGKYAGYNTFIDHTGKIFTDQLYATGVFVGRQNIAENSVSVARYASARNISGTSHTMTLTGVPHGYPGKAQVRLTMDFKVDSTPEFCRVFINSRKRGSIYTHYEYRDLLDIMVGYPNWIVLPAAFDYEEGIYDYEVQLMSSVPFSVKKMVLETLAVWR
ncbi:phage tail protein [Photobacterium sp. MCCC 1A19761]|uniref:host specificity protein J n=1 Tax=Photobacterium sp. MCCC 1A19761 TaxID=3115000 RepID=UPI00307CF324